MERQRDIKAGLKQQAKPAESTMESTFDTRTVFVGDDSGLLKKLRMTVERTKETIVEPAKRNRTRKRNDGEREDDAEEEVEEDKIDEGIFKDRADVQMKLVNKYGSQEKDQGIQYLQWTLGS